jgi:protein-S-isoprenylcysteine O-methyltransferase Ste14
MSAHLIAVKICNAAWLVMAGYWFVGMVRTGASAREPLRGRLGYTVPLVLGLFLLFDPRFDLDFLGRRFVPENWVTLAIGVGLTIAGVCVAIWARGHLGMNWSGAVIVKADHELIETGPYALVRHPIYTGISLAAIGSALVGGKWRALAAVVLIVVSFCFKAAREDRLLLSHFGEAYARRKDRVGFLLPRLKPTADREIGK